MAFRRKTSRKNKSYSRRKVSNKSVVRTAKKVVQRELNKIIEPEVSIATYTSPVIQGSGFRYSLLPAGAGDDATGATYGMRKKFLSLAIKGTVFNTDAVDRQLRIMIIKDRFPTETAIATTDVITAEGMNTFPVFKNKQRFTIIRDMKLTLPANGVGQYTRNFKYYKKLNMVVPYRLISTAYRPAIQYYMFLMSNDSAVGVDVDISSQVTLIDA